MKPFQYYLPGTLEEVLKLLAAHKGEAKVVAGGTDLINQIKRGEICPKCLISLNAVATMQFISKENGLIRIGAGTNLRAIETSLIIKSSFPILAQAAGQIGSPQIRNRGTIGGNLVNAAPSADMAAPLLALNAAVTIVGLNKKLEIPIQDLFQGPGVTSLEEDSLLHEITVPIGSINTRALYYKLGPRMGMDIATVGVAVAVTPAKTGTIEQAAIALGAVAPTPIRARKTEQMLLGQSFSEELIEEAATTAAEEANPISDQRASANYRKEMVKVLVRRGLRETWQKN
ncbi:MAG: xanthine dehydrogenase family protein subunit M [Candidatus Tectomicrobia bacterium]|uniref:Xanthine dehydrogenase family protein subunit M n=1 Tax=Tectimicrobiota bacterium TaxID=2528274 RepID=A0A933GMD4_UNCTE|nr:xanthine dehydrogenase family protein subunit M [Candidatus Tectomicrobia bacterium]